MALLVFKTKNSNKNKVTGNDLKREFQWFVRAEFVHLTFDFDELGTALYLNISGTTESIRIHLLVIFKGSIQLLIYEYIFQQHILKCIVFGIAMMNHFQFRVLLGKLGYIR